MGSYCQSQATRTPGRRGRSLAPGTSGRRRRGIQWHPPDEGLLTLRPEEPVEPTTSRCSIIGGPSTQPLSCSGTARTRGSPLGSPTPSASSVRITNVELSATHVDAYQTSWGRTRSSVANHSSAAAISLLDAPVLHLLAHHRPNLLPAVARRLCHTDLRLMGRWRTRRGARL